MVENNIESDSVFYHTTLALLVQSCQRWNTSRLIYLGRLLVPKKGSDQRQEKQILEYSVYKPALVSFAIVNGIYNIVLKVHLDFSVLSIVCHLKLFCCFYFILFFFFIAS